jgi:signal peptidase II
MSERSYRGLFWGLVLGGTTVDQVSKYGVFRWLYHDGNGGEHPIIPGAFKFLAQFTNKAEPPDNALAALRTWSGEVLPKVNQGALFGFGGEYRTLANGLFAVVSILAALAIVYWSSRRATARDRFLCAALGLILAGTLGNLYDRLVFNGVRDFLYFYWIEWPVFNIADCCLVCGAFLLLSQAFWGGQPSGAKEEIASETVLAPQMAETP